MRYYILLLSILFSAKLSAQRARIILDKWDVLYAGVDNLITVKTEGINYKDATVFIEGATITPADTPCKFHVRLTKTGTVKAGVVTHTSKGEQYLYQTTFQVKELPIAFVGGKSGGYMCLKIFKVQMGIVLRADGVDSNTRLTANGYTITIVRDGQSLFEKKCIGATFDDETIKQFDKLRIGDKVIISEIILQTPDGLPQSLSEKITLTMKEC